MQRKKHPQTRKDDPHDISPRQTIAAVTVPLKNARISQSIYIPLV